MAQVKARLGEHAGEGIAAFLKGLRQDATDDLRRDLQSRSDTNVVKLLSRFCDEVATALDCGLVLAIDECQRLTDDDQRALASLSLSPPKRARVMVAWSSAVHEARDGLVRLRDTRCGEVVVGGLSRDEVASLLSRARIPTSHTDRVHFLSEGFPVIVEGLIGQLRSGGSLDAYTPPTAFVRSLEDALARLPADSQVAARRLSAFDVPPTESTITNYLAINATQWGVLRHSLERENVLSVERNGQLWFHESRRSHLWNQMLGDTERLEIGQPAYSALLAQYRGDTISSTGLMVPISQLAGFAAASQAETPQLAEILDLTTAQLAVLASVIELEITHPHIEGSQRWTPPETALIYAHNFFGADRADALAAIPVLLERGFITSIDQEEQTDADPPVACTISDDPYDECRIVLYGRIQISLGKSVVPQLTGRIVHEHFEALRLESTIVISSSGTSDPIDLVRTANEQRYYRFNPFQGTTYPMLALWVEYGGQPVCMAAIFNRVAEMEKAKRAALNVDEVSYGRRVKVVRTFEDRTGPLPSMRFFRAAYFASGRPVEADAAAGKWWLRNEGPPLPIREYARRQIDLLQILHTRVDDVERDIYALEELRGAAVGQDSDGTYLFVELRGGTRVIEMSEKQIETAQSDAPFKFARLEHMLDLRNRERTKQINGRTQTEGLIDDPVINALEDLWTIAREYNKTQQPRRVKLQKSPLTRLLREAHIRDMTLARELSERLTIGGARGHRPQRALRVAVHPGAAGHMPPAIAYTMPIGNPSDVQIRFVPRTVRPTDSQGLYALAFGGEAPDELYGGEAPAMVSSLTGYDDDEIELVS